MRDRDALPALGTVYVCSEQSWKFIPVPEYVCPVLIRFQPLPQKIHVRLPNQFLISFCQKVILAVQKQYKRTVDNAQIDMFSITEIFSIAVIENVVDPKF